MLKKKERNTSSPIMQPVFSLQFEKVPELPWNPPTSLQQPKARSLWTQPNPESYLGPNEEWGEQSLHLFMVQEAIANSWLGWLCKKSSSLSDISAGI